MFKVGDKVKFKKSSIDTGMIDATEDDVFTILYVEKCYVMLKEQGSWWNVGHFEHVKEGIMNNTEEQEIKWEVGQEVWCLIFGKGVVHSIDTIEADYPVGAEFSGEIRFYTKDGKYYDDHHRTLFFSEPKIEAEKFPPKKPFVPVFKKGDRVVVTNIYNGYQWIDIVEEENEDCVTTEKESAWLVKSAHKFYKIGEEIKFS